MYFVRLCVHGVFSLITLAVDVVIQCGIRGWKILLEFEGISALSSDSECWS